jgi:hypothetical protein
VTFIEWAYPLSIMSGKNLPDYSPPISFADKTCLYKT